MSLPNTPPQVQQMIGNPFSGMQNNLGRERSQTITQQHQPEGGAFQPRHMGGVTGSSSGFFTTNNNKTMDINDGASFVGTSLLAAHPQMTPIQDAFSLQDPKILSQQSTLSSRRKLPSTPFNLPTPSELPTRATNQTPSPQFGTNPSHQISVQVRRVSSSRMLPNPPCVSLSPSPSPPCDNRRSSSSTGRKLPSEPIQIIPTIPASSLPPPAPSTLQRSASARTTNSVIVNTNNNKAAQLPPPSPRSSISTSPTATTQQQFQQNIPTTTAALNNTNNTELTTSTSAMSRLAPDHQASNGHAHGGQASPRQTRNSMTEGSPSFVFARKFSTDIGRDNLSRNGSMAHLLEQQHLLRREFTATPDSMAHSNNSSLSPSIEQLNCAVSTKSSSDGDDPSVHGLDPSLYSADGKTPQTPTNSTSVPDIASTANSHSSTTIAQTASATNNENEPRPKGLGLIYCTLQHFPVRKRLRVSVLKIEGLAGELRPDLEIQPFCRVNILPGKQNKQQTSFVKRGRDIVFNQEFFFDGIATEDIENKSLSIEVCHQSATKLQKDLEIGEICVPLKDLTQLYSKKEVKIIEELKHRPNSKKLGKLYITTCIDKEARLTINIIKVDDLPKFGIIGAPDVCVRITMSQGNSNPQTKSSRILKSTCSAVYKEAVMFLISTKKNDLQNTKITISVHDISRSVTGDDVIGSAFLGQLAVDKSEIEQWKNTMDHLGKEYKGSHQLKQLNQTQIHVSEVPPDEEDDLFED